MFQLVQVGGGSNPPKDSNAAWPGGCSGGGSINIFFNNQKGIEVPSVNVDVNGGKTETTYGGYGDSYKAGNGGLGSWEIGTINEGSYKKISP